MFRQTGLPLLPQEPARHTFSGTLPATRSGTYATGVSVTADGQTVLSASTLASESYPAEFSPGKSDPELMAKISTLSNGRGEIAAEQAFDSAGLIAGYRRIALAGPFLLLAALLWPLAVLLSRLSLRGTSVAGARAGLGRVGSRVKASLPTIAQDPQNLPAPRATVHPPVQQQSPKRTPATQAPPPQTATLNDLVARKRERLNPQQPRQPGDGD